MVDPNNVLMKPGESRFAIYLLYTKLFYRSRFNYISSIESACAGPFPRQKIRPSYNLSFDIVVLQVNLERNKYIHPVVALRQEKKYLLRKHPSHLTRRYLSDLLPRILINRTRVIVNPVLFLPLTKRATLSCREFSKIR